jgi:hypothetical protein
MSSDLSVRLTKPVSILDVLSATSVAMNELLGCSTIPIIEAYRIDGRNQSLLMDAIIEDEKTNFVIRMLGEPETVGVFFTNVPNHPMLSPHEVGIWIGIVVAAMRTPLEFILAASIAIAFGRLGNTTIFDDGLRWSGVFEQPVNEFVVALKTRDVYDDVRQALQHVSLKAFPNLK